MNRIPTKSNTPRITIKIGGDLDLRGWDRQEIEINGGRERESQASQDGDFFAIDASADCEISIPAGAVVEIERVGGDGRIRNSSGSIAIHKVGGTLQARQVAQIKLDHVGGDLELEDVSGGVEIGRVGGDFIGRNLSSELRVETVGGDMSLLNGKSKVEVHLVGGDLNLEQTAEVQVDKVGNDARLDHIQGNCRVRHVNGDLTVRDIQGELMVESAGGDVSAAEIAGPVRITSGGDVRLILTQLLKQDSRVQAGGDLLCQVPPDSNLDVEIASGRGKILLDLPGQVGLLRTTAHRLVVGHGGVHLILRSGGEVLFTSQAADWSDQRVFTIEYESGFENFGRDFARDFDDLGRHLKRVIKQRVESAHHSAHAAERAEDAARQVSERMDAAMRRLERRGIRVDFPFSTPQPSPESSPAPVPSAGPERRTASKSSEPPAVAQAAPEPVSDEERLIILRMLQEKKITMEQAEQLLEALDDLQ